MGTGMRGASQEQMEGVWGWGAVPKKGLYGCLQIPTFSSMF